MADILDHLHEARRLDAQERRDREQRWTLPETAEGWRSMAHKLALRVVRQAGRCSTPSVTGDPCTACCARAVERDRARDLLHYLEREAPWQPVDDLRRSAHLRAPCIDHDALVCPDTSCTGAIGDGSHDGAPPTCDSCGITWGRCVDCEAVHDHERACPACAVGGAA